MKKIGEISKSLLKHLEKHGVGLDDILACTCMDMNLECNFAFSWLVLTADKLIMVAMPPEKDAMLFGGLISPPKVVTSEAETKLFALDRCGEAELINMVSGGLLYIMIDGVDTAICAMSNTYMSDMRRFLKIFGKVKAAEELCDQDYEKEDRLERCAKCGTPYPDRNRKVCPKCMDHRSIFMRLLGFFKPHKGKLALMFLMILGTALVGLFIPYLNGTILYGGVLERNPEFAKKLGVGGMDFAVALLLVVITTFAVKALSQLMAIVQGVVVAKMVPFVISSIKSKIFSAMGRLSISFYSNKQTGGLMTRVLDDAEQVTSIFIDGFPYLFVNIITVIGATTVMFLMNWKLAIAAIVLLPLLSIFSYLLTPKLWSLNGKRHRSSRSLSSQINDNLTGARVVKAFGQENTELKRFEKYNLSMREAELKIVNVDNQIYALYASFQNFAQFIVWGLGSVIVLRHMGMGYGDLITFVGYIGMLNGPLDNFSFMFRWWISCMNSAQRIFEIIDANPEVVEPSNPTKIERVEGSVELKNVTFAYDKGKPVLKDINLKVEAGQMLGVVGHSGAGKSTLVNLISRLYDADEGAVLIDGINVRDMSFHDLRKSIAMVSQETYIFMGTVADNIAYSNPDVPRSEIVAAAITASAHDFICKMPDGYDTIIGASGRELSGGERQRISIARAILANPRILILDEATASVDTETEQSIQRSLDMLVKGRTTISVAHRLSTLKSADYLVVIEDGKVTEVGTHTELLKKKGTYYKLAQLQSKALAMRGVSD